MMSERKRRWWPQFTISTIMLLMTVIAAYLAGQQSMKPEIESLKREVQEMRQSMLMRPLRR